MKNLLTVFSIAASFCAFAQQKGATPLTQSPSGNPKSSDTWAVVVGISDYQDKDIPDLRFADRDAEAFANFLRSAGGGSLDADHLKILTNEQATAGRIAEALDGLIEQAKEGDHVIIYFSGHGDVERKIFTQPGFLLCWDAPSRVYMGGGTYSLSFLEAVVTTLSVQNKAKVTVITDACHAGKLAGNQIGGAQLTAANLARQFANEVKILSCQPDEYSLEGEQWGGGRGCFSYHLVDGLFGLADRNDDGTVTVGEIDRYLEDKVTAEAAPQSQVPMLLGNKTERLAMVNVAILEELKKSKSAGLPVFAATESRGFEDEVLTAVDTTIREMYRAFKLAVQEKRFFTPAGNSAEDYYAQLSEIEALAPLRGFMKRNYAAALQDEAQQTLNEWLKIGQDVTLGATATIRLPRKVFTEKVRSYPLYLDRAADLLGSKHYMYASLKARKYFFEGYLLTNSNMRPNRELGQQALALFRKSLEWQPELPQTFWQMSRVFGYILLQPDSSEAYGQRAIELNPSWALPSISLGFIFSQKFKQFDRAKPYLEQAMLLDSNSSAVRNGWGAYFRSKKNYLEAESSFKKAIQLDSTSFAAYNNLGLLYSDTRRYREAAAQYKKAIQLDSTFVDSYINLGVVYNKVRRYTQAEVYFKKAVQLDSTSALAHNNLGHIYSKTDRYAEAEKLCNKAIQLDSTFAIAYLTMGNIYQDLERFDEAAAHYKKAFLLDSTFADAYNNLGNIYLKNQRYEEAETLFKKANQLVSTEALYINNLGVVYKDTRRNVDAETYFLKAIQVDSTFWMSYANLGLMYQDQEKWEASETMTKKAIQFGPPFGLMVAILGNAYTHLPGRMEDAKKELDKAIEMSPDASDIYKYLTQWALKNNQTEQAWQYIEVGLEKGLGSEELKVSDLQEEPDFEEMRNDPRWDKLMKKHFPDQFKD